MKTWALIGGTATGGKNTKGHRQFVIDREAEMTSVSWNYVKADSPDDIRNVAYELDEFQWCFDKFKVKNKNGTFKEQNIELGNTSTQDTVRWYLNKEPGNGSFKNVARLLKENGGVSVGSKTGFCGFNAIKGALLGVGSELIEAATEEITLEI